MIKFTLPTNIGGNITPYTFFIGQPESGRHPLYYQSEHVTNDKFGSVPAEVMQAIENIMNLAEKNNMRADEFMLAVIESTKEPEGEPDGDNEAGA